MRNLAKQLKLNSATWSLVGGLMLVGLLGACSEVHVTVDTCATRTGGGTPPEPGACTNGPILTAPANAYGAHIYPTGGPITDHNHTCNVNTRMCASPPGTSGLKPCWTKFKPSPIDPLKGDCSCEAQF